MTAVRAAQLVYSNVEAEHSPTARRGFQVWLCSRRLRDAQREIARRLEDYEWPAPDAAANKPTARLVFFRLGGGDFVVARTVPLVERDALHRGGRFHAHAVVLPEAEFAKVGNDPFRVLDHFPFQSSPAEVIAAGVPSAGSLPDETELTAGPAVEPSAAMRLVVSKLLPVVCRWLDAGDDPRPAAISDHPDRVADFLRAAFAALPPALRAKASFDTLSAGQSFGTVPYRFAGGFDGPTVRDWAYRRAYRLDLDAAEFPVTPPPDPALDHLADRWCDATLSDAERESSYRLAATLRTAADVVLPDDLPERGLQLIADAPGVSAAFARRVRDRVAADLPFPALRALVETAAGAWVGPFGRDAVRKVSAAVPVAEFAGWLFERASTEELAEEPAAELERWAHGAIATAADPALRETLAKLYLIGVRWQPEVDVRLAELRGRSGWGQLVAGWFPGWFPGLSTVTAWLAAEGPALQLAEAVLVGPARLPAATVSDLRIALAVAPPADLPDEVRHRLAFAAAFRTADADGLRTALTAGGRGLAGWVIGLLPQLGVARRLALGDVDGQQPGLLLAPTPAADPALVGTLFDVFAESVPAQFELLDGMWKEADGKAPKPVVYPKGALADADRCYDNSRFDKLPAALAALTPTNLRQFLTDRLHDKCRVARPAASRMDGSCLWVGPAVESNNLNPGLFKKLFAAAVAAAGSDPAREAARVAALLGAVRVRPG